jgi:hypothetical protein
VKQLKKAIILAVAIGLLLAGVAIAGVVSSNHDMRLKISDETTTQVCVYCHHPHRGANATITETLLWNMNDWDTTQFQTYGSASISATTTGDNLGTSGAASFSYLCLACHDGTIGGNAELLAKPADGSAGTSTSFTGQANLGTTLVDDHPVDFNYISAQTTDTAGIKASTAAPAGRIVQGAGDTTYPLYANTMQCATCHNVHDGTVSESVQNIQFMRGAGNNVINNSQICQDCHINK